MKCLVDFVNITHDQTTLKQHYVNDLYQAKIADKRIYSTL